MPHDADSYPAFQPRRSLFNGDLQTLRNAFAPHPPPPPGERIFLAMGDDSGDRLAASLHRPEPDDPDKPIVLLAHGLSGCEDSSYMPWTAHYLYQRGYASVRLNLRGAGPSRASCRWHYHAGRSEDLKDAVLALGEEAERRGVVLIGFSLGGNMVLKFAAEYASELPVRGVASVSAPIDLELTSANLLRRRNTIYNKKLLWDFKRQCTGAGASLTVAEWQVIRKSRNFLEIDNDFVAPRNGFLDARDYYRRCMAKQFLNDIRLPCLMLQARDDPLVPAAPYLDIRSGDNRHLHLLLSTQGGHMGFHGNGGPWYLACFAHFLRSLD